MAWQKMPSQWRHCLNRVLQCHMDLQRQLPSFSGYLGLSFSFQIQSFCTYLLMFLFAMTSSCFFCSLNTFYALRKVGPISRYVINKVPHPPPRLKMSAAGPQHPYHLLTSITPCYVTLPVTWLHYFARIM